MAAQAVADSGMPAALRSAGRLDVLSGTPAAPSRRAPCIHARLAASRRNLVRIAGNSSDAGRFAPSTPAGAARPEWRLPPCRRD
jgi:hypothetical protein